MKKNKIPYIVHQFLPKSDIILTKELEGGIINQTFLIRIKANPCKQFILQQINHSVFPDVPALMSNLKIITEHLHKASAQNKQSSFLQTFLYYQTIEGAYYYQHSDDTYWRLSDFIAHEDIVNPKNLKLANEAGKLFAYFIGQLTDVDLKKINEIIPGFHDSEKYFKLFIKAVKKDKTERLNSTKEIYEEFIKFKYLIEDFIEIKKNKNIPVRLVHNDTKIDNILFDSEGHAVSVIDLDTCMPGYLMSDFGDAIRSLSNTCREDEKDVNKVSFDFKLYESFAKGFLKNVESFILPQEKENLAFFALLITYEQALRFYTDYLSGDIYYHIDYPEHNLQRTRVQLKLLNEMNSHFKAMEKLIKEF